MRRVSLWVLSFISVVAYADDPVSLTTLQNQVTSLQQAIAQQQQTNTASLSNLQDQLNKLAAQINQYAAPDFKKFTWAASDGTTTPSNAFVAARNGNTPLYICQAAYSGANSYGSAVIDPGVLTDNGCVITYGGQSYLAPNYSVLVSTSTGAWADGQQVVTQPVYHPIPVVLAKASTANNATAAPATPAATKSNQPTPLLNQIALVGGQENGQSIYICRVNINGQYFLGKAANNTCYIAVGSKEANWPTYEVLLVRQPNVNSQQ